MLLFFKHNHLREFYLLSAAILNAIVIQNRRFSVRVSNYIVVITQFYNTCSLLFQVGFKTSRFYWSMKTLYKRSRYICSIKEKEGKPEFMVTVVEQGQENIVVQNPTCCGVWKSILEPLEKLHKEADLVKVFPAFTTGEELYGLTDPNIIRLVESVSKLKL